jgi:hypothetical protein
MSTTRHEETSHLGESPAIVALHHEIREAPAPNEVEGWGVRLLEKNYRRDGCLYRRILCRNTKRRFP